MLIILAIVTRKIGALSNGPANDEYIIK